MPASRLIVPAHATWQKPDYGARLDRSHPLARGLDQCYLFNEGSGTVIFDLASKGGAANGTLASVTRAFGRAGAELKFDGTAAHGGTLTTSFAPGGGSFAIEIYATFSSLPAASTIKALLMNTGEVDGFCLDGPHFALDGSTGTPLNTSTLVVNTYYHIVAVYDSVTPVCNYWLNGVADGAGGVAGTLTGPFTLLGASNLSGITGNISWMRCWKRTLTGSEAMWLFADPFGMFTAPSEEARSFAFFGGPALPAPSPPVLSAALLAGARPAPVAPFPNLVVLASPPAGNIVSGSVTFISNSTLAESAQVVAPATMQANALLSEAAQVLTPATIQANSALVEAPARVVAPATVQSNSALAESAQVLAPATVQANSLLTESVQVVEPLVPMQANSLLAESAQLVEAAAANVQATSALALPTAQVVDPSLPFVSNSLLAVTGGLAGAGGGTIVSNSALVETAAQIRAPATLASGSVLAQSAAQLHASVATVQSNSVLQVTGSVLGASTGPTSITVSDVALWATAVSDAALWATAVSDAPLASTGLGDAAMGSTSVGDVALAQTALTDA